MTKYGIKRACIAIAVLFAVNIAVITLAQRADAASYKRGSTGSVVSEIQQKLKDWGYYSADVDGVYGSRTEAAVLLFQQKNGLAADGKAGAETLAALGISSAGLIEQNTSGDVALLARLISAEARGESYEGQVAVGAVVGDHAGGQGVERFRKAPELRRIVREGGFGDRFVEGCAVDPVAQNRIDPDARFRRSVEVEFLFEHSVAVDLPQVAHPA
mgnify:CR=1 FL=1